MTTTTPTRKRTALATAVAVAASTILGGVIAATAAADPAPVSDTVDYFDTAYTALGANSVYEAVTFERFEKLLGSEGTYAFLIGGPDDATTTATIGHINEVAAAYGVDAIYNFNPKLDGVSLDARTSTIPEVAALYTRLVDNYLNKDTTPAFTKGASDPYFFIYDKSHTEGGTEDRIVASLAGPTTATELTDSQAIADYEAQVSAVFDSVSSNGVADLDSESQFEFFSTAVNARHASQYADSALYGGDILTADDSDFRLQSITYPELVNILNSEGNYTILFGGTWCHNTRAVIKSVNREAVENNVDTVYVFDLRLDGLSGNVLHIRDSSSALSYLYGDLAVGKLTNLVTQYVPSAGAGQRVDFFPGGDTSQAVVSANKLQVPYLIQYDKDNVEAGVAAPIVQEWIQNNGDGTFKEYMTEWWWVNHLSGSTRTSDTARAANWAFADQGIAAIGTFFDNLTATAPSAPAAPTAIVSGTSVTVNWSAPADGGSAITEYQVALNGATPATVTGSTSHTFTGLAAGSYTATVSATNAIGGSAASSPSGAVTVAASTTAPVDPTTVKGTVTVTGEVRPGGTITVTGTGYAANTPDVVVELHSAPHTLGTVTTTATGGFALTARIPADVAAGSHSIVVAINGVEVSSTAVQLAAANSSLASTGNAVNPLVLWLALGAVIGGVLTVTVFASRRSRAAN